MLKTKGKTPDKICQLIYLKYTHTNRNNNTKILYIFTGNVKPYIKFHIWNFTIPMNESPN